MQVYFENGQYIRLADKPFAAGGEGALYEVLGPSSYVLQVAKIYHPHKRGLERQRKLEYLFAHPPAVQDPQQAHQFIWPNHLLYDEKKQFLGFLMNKAVGEKLELLCAPKLPKNLDAVWQPFDWKRETALRLRLRVLCNLAVALSQLHATGHYVLVDLKPENVIIQANGLISLVDLDSIEVLDEQGKALFAANVVTPEYCPPEYYRGVQPGKVGIPSTWDVFSFAVIVYRVLLGIHPFAASSKPPKDHLVSLGDKIEHGLFVHDPQLQNSFLTIPPPHRGFEQLDEALRDLFWRTFVQGHQEPSLRPDCATWLRVIYNHPALLVERSKPSSQLQLQPVLNFDLYDVAVKQFLEERNAQLASASKPRTQALSFAQPSNLKTWWQSLAPGDQQLFKGLGIAASFVVVGILFRYLIRFGLQGLGYFLGAMGRGLGGILRFTVQNFIFVLLFVFIPALLWYFGRKRRQVQLNRIKQTRSTINPNVKLGVLENQQYQFFEQRSLLQQNVAELKAQLQTIEQTIEKRDDEIRRNFNLLLGETAYEVKSTFQNQITQDHRQILSLDQQAQQLMDEEAQEIRQYRQALYEWLQQAPWAEIPGQNLSQKLQQLDRWAAQQHWSPQAIEQARETLSLRQQQVDLDLRGIQQKYDELQHQLLQQAQQKKANMDHTMSAFMERIKSQRNYGSLVGSEAYLKLHETRQSLQEHILQQEEELQQLTEDLRIIRQLIKEKKA